MQNTHLGDLTQLAIMETNSARPTAAIILWKCGPNNSLGVIRTNWVHGGCHRTFISNSFALSLFCGASPFSKS
jgi:hypothetical protein